MKSNRKIIISILWILLGIGLLVAGLVAEINSFWSGMGAGFIFVGALQLFRWVRYARNEEYRKDVDTEVNDERNRFLAGKAWSWAGYLFVLISAVASIVFRIADQELLCYCAAGAMSLVIALYWVSYLILKKKY